MLPLLRSAGRSAAWRAPFRCRSLTLQASEFQSILEEQTVTGKTFAGAPLSTMSPKMRGEVFATAARSVVSELHPEAQVEDAVAGICCNGSARGRNRCEYDWLWNWRRVECKSAQLSWNRHVRRWSFAFRGIKFALGEVRPEAAFDKLMLILYTPDRAYFYWHDLQLGISTNGKATEVLGHDIYICGPTHESCWEASLSAILAKLDFSGNACVRIADLSLDAAHVAAAARTWTQSTFVTETAYRGVPLACLSPSARGRRLEQLTRLVDSKLHPDIYGMGPIDSQPLASCASYDWLRGGLRVECKSSQLVWCHASRRWRLSFKCVKINHHGGDASAFDILLLALYTPFGVHMVQHDLSYGISSVGAATAARGHNIQVIGPRRELDIAVALETILSKLASGGCRRLAFVAW